MMSARKTERCHRGATLIEMATVMAISGILVYTSAYLLEIALNLMQRVRTQEVITSQVDPVKELFQTHVRLCRFALFGSRVGAENNDQTQLIASQNSGSSSDFALRCTRRDGQGVFIVFWAGPSSTIDGTVYVETGTATGAVQTAWNDPVPLTRSFSSFSINTSQGFVEVAVQIPLSIASVFARNQTTGGQTVIPYDFIVESTL